MPPLRSRRKLVEQRAQRIEGVLQRIVERELSKYSSGAETSSIKPVRDLEPIALPRPSGFGSWSIPCSYHPFVSLSQLKVTPGPQLTSSTLFVRR